MASSASPSALPTIWLRRLAPARASACGKSVAGKVILATGAFERPIAFAGNDLPGVMLASAAQTYARRYAALPGQRIVVCTNNDSAYAAAFAMEDSGATVVAIVDTRSQPGAADAQAQQRGITILRASAPLRARGGRRVASLDIIAVEGGGVGVRLACDTVLLSDGWNPAVHLHSQSGGGLAYDDALQAFLPGSPAQASVSVGAAAGVFDIAAAIAGARGTAPIVPSTDAIGPGRRFADGDTTAQSAWVDFQNDVTVADIQLAARENSAQSNTSSATPRSAWPPTRARRRMSRASMSCRDCSQAGTAIGTTKFRPPFDPVTIGAFAGRAVGDNLMPLGQMPSHEALIALGARMEPYGGWLRPAFVARAHETEHQAVTREVLAVRGAVGLFDASPLGKIEVKGPDAAEFLQRTYVNGVRTLKVGSCRYGLMLSEHGIVYDDGVLARIADNHFLVGTTSGHAAAIADTLHEWLQCEWPDLCVLVENVTAAWAVMNLAGPQARAVLAALGTDVDLSPSAFPHMAYRAGTVAGVKARIQRVSFSGELSYEVSVPWGYGAALWDAMMAAGHAHGITAFGVEALMAMRIEKGFLHVGSDTDGTTYPQDLGFGHAMAAKPDDFVGRRSAMRPDALRDDRRQFVGLEVSDGGSPLEVGAHVLPAGATEARGTLGWITSSAASPTLGRPLALGLVTRGAQRIGEAVRVWDMGTWREARIADPRFYDPKGERLDG